MFLRLSHAALVMVIACITLMAKLSHAGQSETVAEVEGWKIKSRRNAEGKFLACSMERFFRASKGDGRLRLNIIAWPESVIVLLRGNEGFLGGAGVGQFDIVSNERQLYAGKIRFENSELMFALNGRTSRQHVAASKGWSLSKDGERFARFPMTGAAAAMKAVERCAKLSPQIAVAEPTIESTPVVETIQEQNADIKAVITNASGPSLAGGDELTRIARFFSQEIGRPDFRITNFDGGVLQWSYSDALTSGATSVTQLAEPAATYAAALAIRPDQCADSILTLPLMTQTVTGGEHAAVVSMCRGKSSVKVRHVHVVRRGGGLSYVLNFETETAPDGTGMPERSDMLADAFGAALSAAGG